MSSNNGPWKINNHKTIFSNNFFQVFEDNVIQPDGKSGSYGTVHMKPGVAILPVTKDGYVYLAKQFRYVIGQDSLEVCCGGIDNNEDPFTTAKRELKEELGIEAEQWTSLGEFQLDTSIVKCPVYLFLAQGLELKGSKQEATEDIDQIKMPFSEAVEKVLKGEIHHAHSCILILKAWNLYKDKYEST